ncbi:lipid kinase [Microlunatus antarcticus]|uniref:YegS/Rv2252/BmrU family lipid kinase n=1 Tax=Microlunatus antarcticus TaxID=53388 RepID=A0A7W5P6L0_9ACTN|nr:YegS/Rv2252/BmrU family lipid kinase [Microlunatus antarcticus]
MTTTTDRAALIVNTASRRGAVAYETAHRLLLERGVPIVDAFPVTDPARLRETVEQAVANDHGLVVVGGGDGTVSSVVDALVGTGVTLGLLPLGTANDLARTLEVPLALEAACATVAHGKVVDIDVGRIGGTAFLNVASLGLSVEVARSMSPLLKRRLGPLAYPLAAVPAYRRHRAFTAELTFPAGDHEPVRLPNLLQLAVGNGRFYGGGNAVSVEAGIDDHSLDVYAIPHGRFREHVNVARSFRSGGFVEHPEVVHLRTRAVDVATDHPMSVNVDGEIIATTPVSFTVSANALDVLVPQGSTAARQDREASARDR